MLRKKLAKDGRLVQVLQIPVKKSQVAVAPVTGAQQNIGYARERDFYLPYFSAAYKAGIGICAGDGFPDEKLKLGAEAVRELQKTDKNLRASVFLKPYPNEKLFERISWIEDIAETVGLDIDAYNIVTMRNQVNLEKKTPEVLAELRKHIHMPFALKGIFTAEDMELVKQVKPDIVVVSNHGGRIDTREGSTAEFLYASADELHKYCGQVWVDGGIRLFTDVQTALYCGADRVLAARPFISALCRDGERAMIETALSLTTSR